MASEWWTHYILSYKRNVTKNWINEKRYRNLSIKHPSIIKLKSFAFEYAGFIFSVKNILTMKKFNKSYGWTPYISNLALLFFFCKIWPSNVWKCNETKRLDFDQFLRFWVVNTFLKSYGSFFNVYWRWMRYSNLIQKIKFEKTTLLFLYIKLLGCILLSRCHKIKQYLYLAIIQWYILTWNKYSKQVGTTNMKLFWLGRAMTTVLSVTVWQNIQIIQLFNW